MIVDESDRLPQNHRILIVDESDRLPQNHRILIVDESDRCIYNYFFSTFKLRFIAKGYWAWISHKREIQG
ncbi:hypothetical protein, partial [Nostoc piscinale]|uniref:hypothetical protein n=1 Tax=Nostoc piscinale TaxID=224012 RepID=UPI0039A43646